MTDKRAESEGGVGHVVVPPMGEKYHEPDCPQANRLDQQYATELSEEEARDEGYEAAGCCAEKPTEAVYEDRNLLACALAQATQAPAGWKPDPESPNEWAIVWIETPTGQVSWHVPREMAERLAPPRRDSGYDGYDRDEKNDRLASWAKEGCWC